MRNRRIGQCACGRSLTANHNCTPLIAEPLPTPREALADVSHDIWSHWMRWQFSVCTEQPNGAMLIPPEKVERWKRQMDTPYSELSEAEKESDREQADKIINVVQTYGLTV